ncbi:Small RNA 2'-O-methyltransferase, partial [Camellia lanceoleosa]
KNQESNVITLEGYWVDGSLLYPPVQFDSKFCEEDDTLPDGTFVRKGTRVTYHPYAMGRMEWVWSPDHLKFKPDRWLQSGVFTPVSPFRAAIPLTCGQAMEVPDMTVKFTLPTCHYVYSSKVLNYKKQSAVDEASESIQNESPGLAIPQKGPCLYRCCLQLPEFSVVSETFKRKDAEQSAAEMALLKLGINAATDDTTVQDPRDELVLRLSYLFSNEFLKSLHTLSDHFRAALQREGRLNGLVPISVLVSMIQSSVVYVKA